MKQVPSHRSMAFLEACNPKVGVQYLQSAIIQLLNDHVPYNETLQVLGVLCVTVDGCADEVVLKVNSTLKRINSLTPPKERSPDLKNNPLQLKLATCFDSILTSDVNDNNDSSPRSLDASRSIALKSRGRKQSKPAKVRPDDYNVDDCTDGVEDKSSQDASPINDGVDCSRKRRHSVNNDVDGMRRTTSFEMSRNGSYDVKVKNESHDEGHYSHSGLDLSMLSKKQSVKQENDGCFASSSNCDEEQVVSTSIVQSTFSHNQQQNLPLSSAKGKFVAFLNHSPNPPAHSTSSSLYRRILPAGFGDFKSHLTNNLFLANGHVNGDAFEIKNEDDYLLDCLSSDGKKRRRRSLEDALTPDEMLEYMGSHDSPETTFVCRICGESSQDLLKYFHHTLSSHKAFICHQCGRCFTTKSSLLRHRPIHTGLRRFACGICHKAFYRKDKCKAHIKKHAEVLEEQDAAYNLQVL